jgi:hypothetical protein
MNFLSSMLSGKGPISTTRAITVTTAFTILGIYVAQNVLAMIKCGGYIDFPSNSVMVLLVVMGAKVGQSIFGEKNVPAVPETTGAPVVQKTDPA